MKEYKIRKLKRNIYKYGNAIMYGVIFTVASIITIVAAANRTDNVAYVDESQLASSVDAVDIENSETQKVAVNETTPEQEATSQETEATVSKVKITADSLNVRKEPSTDAEPLGEVVMNEEYEVVEHIGDWIKIKFNGDEGYISAAFAKAAE